MVMRPSRAGGWCRLDNNKGEKALLLLNHLSRTGVSRMK